MKRESKSKSVWVCGEEKSMAFFLEFRVIFDVSQCFFNFGIIAIILIIYSFVIIVKVIITEWPP